MNKHEGERIIAALTSTIRDLMTEDGVRTVREAGKEKGGTGDKPAPATAPPAWTGDTPKGAAAFTSDVLEWLFQQFKNRMIDDLRLDPVLLQLVAQQKELEVLIEPRIIQLEGSTLRGRLARLLASGWFKEPKATSACRRELARTGADPGGGGTLGQTLGEFVRDGYLTREGEAFLISPGLKVTEKYVEAR